MPNIYTVDSTVRVVANSIEQAAVAYTLDRATSPSSISQEVASANVVVAVEEFAFTTTIEPAPAIGDAVVYPVSGNVKAGSDQVFTAIPGTTYVTFVEWRTVADVLITTDNPAVINIDEVGQEIKAVFST